MSQIHRLLCSHCTFGSSELEPSTAENAAKVLGYSVRRSSLPEPDRGLLRSVFRAVERLLSYDLPRDTPPARKEVLDANTAPRRFVFMPNLGGWQAAAFVSYRTRDTHGRIGSYFADVIAAKLDRDTTPWCPLEILKLWPASNDSLLGGHWWCDSEDSLAQRDSDARWKPADGETPAELRGAAEPLVNDSLLYQFLTLEPTDAPDDPGAIVPPRWWTMPACQRRDLVAALLNAIIQSRKSGGRDTVTVAAEPSVAALLFYGVFRLLPSRLREGIGFSTYEAAPERPLTPLAATSFIDALSSVADLPPEIAAHGFACNTFRDESGFRGHQPIPAGGFVRHAVDLASSTAWERLDAFLAAIDALPRPDFRNLDELARIDAFVTRYVTGGDERESLGTEPAASPGSDGAKFRRIRFRELVGGTAPGKAGKWPCDLLRTAILWLGEDFPKAWNSEGPLADSLRSRLPADNAGLQQVFDALQHTQSMPVDCVRDAVLKVASACSPPALPPAFLQFIAAAGRSRRTSGVTSDITTLTQSVIEGLAERNLQHLIEIVDSEHTDAILDGIEALENAQSGRWRELNVPVVSIIERKLEGARNDLDDQANLFVRHESLVNLLVQSRTDSEKISKEVGIFFRLILQFVQTTPKPLLPGQHLCVNGRSRVKALKSWLVFAPPGESPQNLERLLAWDTVHTSIEDLRESATRASRFRKCPTNLRETAAAYEVLTRDNPGPGSNANQRMQHFLKKSLDGLKVEEPARQTITRWVVAALPDDPDRLELPGSDGSKRTTNQRRNLGTSRRRAWLVGLSTTLGSVAMCAAIFTLWPWPTQPQPAITHHGATVSMPQDSNETPRMSAPETPTRDASAGMVQTATPPAQSDERDERLTAELLSFNAVLKDGAIEVSWTKTIEPETKLTLRVTAPSDIGEPFPHEEEITAVAAGSHRSRFPSKNIFGVYKAQLIAKSRNGPKEVCSKEIGIPITKPSAPLIKAATITVDGSGGPRLCITLRELPAPEHGARSGVVKVDESPLKAPLSDHMEFQLPADKLRPADLLPGKTPLKLHFDTELGSGDACKIPIEVPEGSLEQELNARLDRKLIEDVTHICALDDSFQPGKQTPLLTLPWWFVDVGLKDFSIDLLPSGRANLADLEDPKALLLIRNPDDPKKWECKSGDVSLGFFEIIDADPWKPELVFRAAEEIGEAGEASSDDARKAYARLRTSKLCFLNINRNRPFSTAQLMAPFRTGQMVLALQVEENQDKVAPMVATDNAFATFATISMNLDLHPILLAKEPREPMPDGMEIALGRPEKKFVAKLHVSNALAEIAADVNWLPKRPKHHLRVEHWTWTKVPASDKPDKKTPGKNSKVPAAEKDTVSSKLLLEIGKRKSRLEELMLQIAGREAELDKETDGKKKDELNKRLSELIEEKKALDDLRAEKSDELFVPCSKLLDAALKNKIEINGWQLTWDVQPKSCTGKYDVMPDVPGSLRVVGVLGKKGDRPPVTFEPEK